MTSETNASEALPSAPSATDAAWAARLPQPMVAKNYFAAERPDPAAQTGVIDTPAACEIKYVISTAVAEQIRDWAQQHLAVDCHADAALGGAYSVRSVYLDTPLGHTFRNSGFFRRRKFRLRRYGDQGPVWLERKRKRQGRVSKRRLAVELSLLEKLGDGQLGDGDNWPNDPLWLGRWFARQVKAFQLRPVCAISYRRRAFAGAVSGESLRLTIDDQLTASPAQAWYPTADASQAHAGAGSVQAVPLLTGQQIVEFKFIDAMPAAAKTLLADLRLVNGAFSKYRNGVTACGLSFATEDPAAPGSADV